MSIVSDAVWVGGRVGRAVTNTQRLHACMVCIAIAALHSARMASRPASTLPGQAWPCTVGGRSLGCDAASLTLLRVHACVRVALCDSSELVITARVFRCFLPATTPGCFHMRSAIPFCSIQPLLDAPTAIDAAEG